VLNLVHEVRAASHFGWSTLTAYGQHDFKLLAGLIAGLFALQWLGRSRGSVDFNDHNAIDVESMGLYWHFVDIVWIVIFTAVYLLEYL